MGGDPAPSQLAILTRLWEKWEKDLAKIAAKLKEIH